MNPAHTAQAAMQMRQAAPQGGPQVMNGLTQQQMQMLQVQAAQAQAQAQFSGQMMNGNPGQLVAAGGRVLSKFEILDKKKYKAHSLLVFRLKY